LTWVEARASDVDIFSGDASLLLVWLRRDRVDALEIAGRVGETLEPPLRMVAEGARGERDFVGVRSDAAGSDVVVGVVEGGC
jgi:hypothetical protein